MLNGTYKNYNIRGVEMISGTYNMGKRNGKFTYRNANGGVIKVEYYKNDKPDGKWQEFYDFGGLQTETTYRDGMKEGKFTRYDQRGNITFQSKFLGNRQVEIIVDDNPNLPQNKQKAGQGNQQNTRSGGGYRN